jgi:hypothetical protein
VRKRSLIRSRAERVDTRVLQVIYRFDPAVFPARVGQQVDVHMTAAPRQCRSSGGPGRESPPVTAPVRPDAARPSNNT